MYADPRQLPAREAGRRPRIAVVGAGIAGLAAAHALRAEADTTLFEASASFGGHAHTVDITLPTRQGLVTHGVDTGFLVLNERTYPNLLTLFAELGVDIASSDMSFSVQAAGAAGAPPLEWSGSSLDTVFAQRANLFRPAFLRMLLDILRFNRLCTGLANSQEDSAPDGRLWMPLGEFLRQQRFSDAFCHDYFLPMMACIWSCPAEQMLQFPVAAMVRFCHNHGLLQVSDRPQWFTVRGGSRHYVDKIVAGLSDARRNTPVRALRRDAEGVSVVTDGREERFDHLVLACHSDQALALLGEGATADERAVLGAIRYQPNRAVLHTDASVLPTRRKAWAAWNHERAARGRDPHARVCLHYLLNRLQPLPFEQPVLVSLNPLREIAPHTVLGEYDYAHPVFDLAAMSAQQRIPAMQGMLHTHFAGAWCGYGFHEDGLKAGLQAAADILRVFAPAAGARS
ncbi:NAD(P)/FAD-dependent oxidoreductase [Hydrogenophaga sp. OTU3427]|uniref:NAD(P)/FAD-dependent oxidoreductase n=1 Tax=Hydrogenophaga sp. OTU3427 TaxID=3043856 RepID=UPI00313ED50E